jgi:hypothetical protein
MMRSVQIMVKKRNQRVWPKSEPIVYSCSPAISLPCINRVYENGDKSAVVVAPVVINSAIAAPTAGAVLKPVPLNPAAT